ncbi:MAG: hypothetical protein Q4D62_04545 [Planctomycetia bacterium]|nr:hypothetical protein [Planctomycetia bacterium]
MNCRFYWGMLLFLGVSTAMSEDFLELRNGNRLSGKWLNPATKKPATYRFETSDGLQIEIAAEEVASMDRQGKHSDEYEKRLAQTPDTVEGNLELAQWCSENGLPSRQKIHLRRVLELEPDHAEARRKLGYRRMVDGQWRTAEEEMEEQGKVFYNGRWMSKQEKEVLENKKKDKYATQKMTKAIARWRNDIGTRKNDEAIANIESLTDPLAVPGLTAVLKKEKRQSVRKLFLKALGRIGTPEAWKVLMVLAVNDSDEEIRMSCLDILKVHPNPTITEYFISRLSPKTSTNVQVNRAAQALGELGDRTAIPALIDALITRHKYVINPNQGQTTTTFGGQTGSSGGGFSFGSSQQLVYKQHQNEGALNALKKLTGVNFIYEIPAWKNWYQSQHFKESQ